MKAPRFWNTKNPVSTALLPFSALYHMSSNVRQASINPVRLPVPVICVGNLTAGGAGKTPVALHIGQWMKERNIPAFFLSRGYGGAMQGPVRVDPDRHLASNVGDEPLLLARCLPTIVAKDRVQGGLFAIEQGAKAIIMDDGFQNPSIEKTLSLLVMDGQYGFGNGRLLPAGPLREPITTGLQRAQAFIVLGRGAAVPALPSGIPTLFAYIQPTTGTAALLDKPILAFCGIANPQKFFAMLTALGAHLTDAVSFADHYPYKESDLALLSAKAERTGATLVTTAKDAARLPPSFREKVTVIDITLAFEQEDSLARLLKTALERHEKH